MRFYCALVLAWAASGCNGLGDDTDAPASKPSRDTQTSGSTSARRDTGSEADSGSEPTDSPRSTGTLVIPFQLANNSSCAAAGVKIVRAELNDKAYVQEAPCDSTQVRFRDLPEGSYRFTLFGVDDAGNDISDSGALSDADATVDVAGHDAITARQPPVTLTTAPAHLFVRWDLGFGNCEGSRIHTFVITLSSDTSPDPILQESMDCSRLGDDAKQYRAVADPDRRFDGRKPAKVSVAVHDLADAAVGRTVAFSFPAPGPGHDVRITLDCSSGVCVGSGKLDP